ncbi:helix-turn-helix domain-containing protein [Bacteroides cellulosilyticus]|jgi:hypothetical protein|uniref:helix-turn-helix domain-containing protein n=1 Tax=Bacteroides cellulosilyticus TaxID=246787 RepID=UPI00189E9073|nr:helix-turn-helix domain-containing protein [Bacteroides cellulosilyticus]MBX9088155.1 helix-turn-helix domain-containing protein [Bacteroides cellulosilyticus]QUT92241.1 helix-turn-helix protein domain protein [Bacteroides cellulosilyticus]DAZ48558.1 MAG TPA: helix-turn-helix domain protein [Caudoviricetes sp.]
MEHLFYTSTTTFIQGTTLEALEKMISHLLDKKLANITKATSESDEGPRGDGLYKRKEAAKKLGISLATLTKWSRAGVINYRKIGSRIYYTNSDINNALKSKGGYYGKVR